MIALDTSVIVSIARGEDDAANYVSLIARSHSIVGTSTLVEAHMVLKHKLDDDPREFFEDFLAGSSVTIVDFSYSMFLLAQDAFDRFGKGRGHKAGLNFGDCLSYAVAKHHGIPLLFKGDDFIHTDVEPAISPS